MAMTPSSMLPLGTQCPDFSLIDTVSDKPITRTDFLNRPLLVMFICNHCPFVQHVAPELTRIGRDYAAKVAIVAISSNDVAEYPADAPDLMKAEAKKQGYNFPYLYDPTQAVAKSFDAACTPDIFLFDATHRLAYRGQLDETRPTRVASGVYTNENAPHGRNLRAALDAVLAGKLPEGEQKPSIGCNIKWRQNT